MLTREQRRALHAYECAEAVAALPEKQRADYRTLVNGLAADILRCGLAAGLALLERKAKPDRERKAAPDAKPVEALVLEHLAQAKLPALEDVRDGPRLAEQARVMELRGYMLATREVLRLAVWLRWAVEATFPKEEQGHASGAAEASR